MTQPQNATCIRCAMGDHNQCLVTWSMEEDDQRGGITTTVFRCDCCNVTAMTAEEQLDAAFECQKQWSIHASPTPVQLRTFVDALPEPVRLAWFERIIAGRVMVSDCFVKNHVKYISDLESSNRQLRQENAELIEQHRQNRGIPRRKPLSQWLPCSVCGMKYGPGVNECKGTVDDNCCDECSHPARSNPQQSPDVVHVQTPIGTTTTMPSAQIQNLPGNLQPNLSPNQVQIAPGRAVAKCVCSRDLIERPAGSGKWVHLDGTDRCFVQPVLDGNYEWACSSCGSGLVKYTDPLQYEHVEQSRDFHHEPRPVRTRPVGTPYCGDCGGPLFGSERSGWSHRSSDKASHPIRTIDWRDPA